MGIDHELELGVPVVRVRDVAALVGDGDLGDAVVAIVRGSQHTVRADIVLGILQWLVRLDEEDPLSVCRGCSHIGKIIDAVTKCGYGKGHRLVQQRVAWRRDVENCAGEIRSTCTRDLLAGLAHVRRIGQQERARNDVWRIGIDRESDLEATTGESIAGWKRKLSTRGIEVFTVKWIPSLVANHRGAFTHQNDPVEVVRQVEVARSQVYGDDLCDRIINELARKVDGTVVDRVGVTEDPIATGCLKNDGFGRDGQCVKASIDCERNRNGALVRSSHSKRLIDIDRRGATGQKGCHGCDLWPEQLAVFVCTGVEEWTAAETDVGTGRIILTQISVLISFTTDRGVRPGGSV